MDGGNGAAMRERSRPSRGRSKGDPAIRRSGDPAIRRSGDPAIRRSGDPAIRLIVSETANEPVKRILPAASAILRMLPIVAKSASSRANPKPPQRGAARARTIPFVHLVPATRAEGKPPSVPVSVRGAARRSQLTDRSGGERRTHPMGNGAFPVRARPAPAQFPFHRQRHPLGRLAERRVVEVDVAVGGADPAVTEQASRDMQALAVHDRVRGVRMTEIVKPRTLDRQRFERTQRRRPDREARPAPGAASYSTAAAKDRGAGQPPSPSRGRLLEHSTASMTLRYARLGDSVIEHRVGAASKMAELTTPRRLIPVRRRTSAPIPSSACRRSCSRTRRRPGNRARDPACRSPHPCNSILPPSSTPR